jgi:hypothetical protein
VSRWPIVFVLLGVLSAGLAYDQVAGPASEQVAVVADLNVVSPAMRDPARLDGAWYCAVGSSAEGGFADHEVIVSNLADEPAVATITIITGSGPGPARRIELAPLATERVVLSDTQLVELAAASVEITGGRGVVGHRVTTAQGVAEGPCATHASSSWYFASGRTYRDSTEYLALMNPFPETAVFDVEFQAVGRTRKPGDLQGAFVEAQSVRIIDVSEFVSREEFLAATVTTNRGRLVVERLQLMDGQLGVAGASLQLGVPTPAQSWIFTGGRVQRGGDDLLTIYNPYEVERGSAAEGTEPSREGFATVTVDLWPNNPTDLSAYAVAKIEREVRPGTFVTIDLQAQAERFEFPLPYDLGVYVTSSPDLPVVAERWSFADELLVDGPDGPVLSADAQDLLAEDSATEAEPAAEEADGEGTGDSQVDGDVEGQVDGEAAVGDGSVDQGAVLDGPELEAIGLDLVQPLATTGFSTSRGNELFSSRWVVPWVTIEGDSTVVAIAAIEEAAVEVRILDGGTWIGPIRATVDAGGRAVVPVTSNSGGGVIEVEANTPVSVEATVILADLSMDTVPGVPTFDRCDLDGQAPGTC